MGLREDISNDIAEAFNTDLSDAAKIFTYREVSSIFNSSTNTTTESYVDYLSRGVFTRYKQKVLRDSSILATDVKLILLQHELAVEPLKNMQIISGSKTYTIINIAEDPVDATWVLQCRQ